MTCKCFLKIFCAHCLAFQKCGPCTTLSSKQNAENGHCLVHYYNILTYLCYFLTKALKIERISVQHFLVISHFTFTVKSV